VFGAAVEVHLPVDPSGAHLLLEDPTLFCRHPRILAADADEYFSCQRERCEFDKEWR
jgi:hypothetical protein